jgi:hypothetical protein
MDADIVQNRRCFERLLLYKGQSFLFAYCLRKGIDLECMVDAPGVAAVVMNHFGYDRADRNHTIHLIIIRKFSAERRVVMRPFTADIFGSGTRTQDICLTDLIERQATGTATFARCIR